MLIAQKLKSAIKAAGMTQKAWSETEKAPNRGYVNRLCSNGAIVVNGAVYTKTEFRIEQRVDARSGVEYRIETLPTLKEIAAYVLGVDR